MTPSIFSSIVQHPDQNTVCGGFFFLDVIASLEVNLVCSIVDAKASLELILQDA